VNLPQPCKCDQPRAGNQGLESVVSSRIHHHVHDGGLLFALVGLSASGTLLCVLDGALGRVKGSRTAERLGAEQAEA